MIAISSEDIPARIHPLSLSRNALYILSYRASGILFRALAVRYLESRSRKPSTSISMPVFALFSFSLGTRLGRFVSVRLKKAPHEISRRHYFKEPESSQNESRFDVKRCFLRRAFMLCNLCDVSSVSMTFCQKRHVYLL